MIDVNTTSLLSAASWRTKAAESYFLYCAASPRCTKGSSARQGRRRRMHIGRISSQNVHLHCPLMRLTVLFRRRATDLCSWINFLGERAPADCKIGDAADFYIPSGLSRPHRRRECAGHRPEAPARDNSAWPQGRVPVSSIHQQQERARRDDLPQNEPPKRGKAQHHHTKFLSQAKLYRRGRGNRRKVPWSYMMKCSH